MGASDWWYLVPYQENISQALQDLRNQVFAEGRYFSISNEDFAIRQHDLRSQLELYELTNTKRYNELLAAVKPLLELDATQPPKTIEELILRNETEGTHSILDVDRIDTEPDFGVITPLDKDSIVEVFGTDKPTRYEIEEVLHEGWSVGNLCDRWEGIYVIVYRQGKPDEIFFAGYSGD